MWIHELPNWTQFTWDIETLSSHLADIRYRQGRLFGRMENLGFDLQQEAQLKMLTDEVLSSSSIEGEVLNPIEVRSSIARRLHLDIAGMVPTARHVDGVVDMMLDATQHYTEPVTAERLYGWHAALFPTGRSGIHRITAGQWRTPDTCRLFPGLWAERKSTMKPRRRPDLIMRWMFSLPGVLPNRE